MKTTISLNRGFTLVEIMIVVAIIGLLMAVAIPSLTMARKTAQDTGCISNLLTIWGAMTIVAIDKRKSGSDPVTMEDIQPYLEGHKTRCRGGGEYILDTFAVKPRCTEHGTYSDFLSEKDKEDGDRLHKGSTLYVVDDDDTLTGIARKFKGVSEQSIRDANSKKIIDFDNMSKGQRLTIPDNQGRSNGWILPAIGVLILIFILFKPKRKNNLHSKLA
jgi:prepilin-type N-terminal cleavage/methylation domain-containing protein